MTYATLMVHLEPGRPHQNLLEVTADLASRMRSHVIGIATCQPMPMMYDGAYTDGTVVEQFREEMETELKAAEAEFRRTLQGRVVTLEWRAEMTPGLLVDYLNDQGRSADLVISQAATGDPFDPARAVNTGNLLLQLGRPALVVPTEPHTRRLHRVLVGWKDAREPRRAVADALPLLRLATHVTVAAVAKADGLDAAQRQAHDVVRWLSRHGIDATATAVAGSGQDDAADLHAIAESVQADVIVAGAYGHSRLREWLVGGVTRELLQQRTRCALLSH